MRGFEGLKKSVSIPVLGNGFTGRAVVFDSTCTFSLQYSFWQRPFRHNRVSEAFGEPRGSRSNNNVRRLTVVGGAVVNYSSESVDCLS